MMKRKWISLLLALSLLLAAIPALSADDGTGVWDPYRWDAVEGQGEISRKLADYTGRGTAIAVIDTGFDVSHPAFSVAPQDVLLDKNTISHLVGEEHYVSEKIPYVWDYADRDGDVENISIHGTSAASVAAGMYIGAGDRVQEDGTVIHEASFYGRSPDAQLLLMKAAKDGSARMETDAVAEAIRDALRLGASSIVLYTYGLTADKDLQNAITEAREIGVPVFAGAGDISPKEENPSVLYTDRSTLTAAADLEHLTLIGAAGDPYSHIHSFDVHSGEGDPVEVFYVDSCAEYFGASFAALFAGQEIPTVWIEGVGRPEEYNGIDVEGKLAVVKRGEISFVEKAKNAADAGAVGMIVIDQGDGASRMALEGAPIPAVMIEADAGDPFADGGAVRVVFRQGKKGVASFSATGVGSTLTNTISFVCDGEGIPVAVNPVLSGGNYYTRVSSTDYAAAAAAGYAARCAQYCRLSGFSVKDVLPILAQSATPFTDEQGDYLSPRVSGTGYVGEESVFPLGYITTKSGSPVSAVGNPTYDTAYADVYIRYLGEEKNRFTVSGMVFGDGWVEEDGVYRLSGDIDPLSTAQMNLGDSSREMNGASEGARPLSVYVEKGHKEKVAVRIRLWGDAQKEYESMFACGFYMDAFLIMTDGEGNSIVHPITVFMGDWTSAPLADTTVYDDGPAEMQKTSLSIRPKGSDGAGDLPIGVDNPATFPGQTYDSVYNLFRADGKSLVLSLSALRRIDRIDVKVMDSEGRVVFENSLGEGWSGGTVHTIPLWDFIAVDNKEYIFPDGEYTAQIRLRSSFGDLGSAENTMKFSVTLDSVRPDVVSYSIGKDKNGTPYLAVQARDDTRLATVFAYDGAYSYIPSEGIWGFTAADSVTARMDISGYDYRDPLYIHVSDYAGNKILLRIPSDEVRAALGEG